MQPHELDLVLFDVVRFIALSGQFGERRFGLGSLPVVKTKLGFIQTESLQILDPSFVLCLQGRECAVGDVCR